MEKDSFEQENLKNYISEKEIWERQFWKCKSEDDGSDEEKTEKGHIWTGQIWKMILPKRNDLEKDNSGKL